MAKNMMKFQNSEGFHHVPDQCCHFPPKLMCFVMLFPNPAVFFQTLPFLSSFTMLFLNIFMILPTLPLFTKADMVNSPYNPLWQPFMVCFSTSISNHPRLRAILESNQIFSIILLSMKQSGNHPPQQPLG